MHAGQVSKCLLVALLLHNEAYSSDLIRAVLVEGEPVAGFPVEVTTRIGRAPSIDYLGRVSAVTGLVDGTFGGLALWIEDGTGGIQVLVQGGFGPELSEGTFFNVNSYSVALSGTSISLLGRIDGHDTNAGDEIILAIDLQSPVRVVAQRHTQATGVSIGKTFDRLSEPAVNKLGQSAFSGSVNGTALVGRSRGIWSEGGGNGLRLAMREGDEILGLSGSTVMGFSDPLINDLGETLINARFRTENKWGSGIWKEDVSGGLQPMAKAGDSAPGIPAGTFAFGFPTWGSDLNNSGLVTFSSFVEGEGITSDNWNGIWQGTNANDLDLIVRSGEEVPDTQVGSKFRGFSEVKSNESGQLAFLGRVTEQDVDEQTEAILEANYFDGIWSNAGQMGLAAIAEVGDHAPGTATGVYFGGFVAPVNVPVGLSFNNAGQVAFHARLSGQGVNSGNDIGIWAQDRTGKLRLVAREGDILEVTSGSTSQFKTIERVLFRPHTASPGRTGGGFNDNGELAFVAHFEDGSSGIFVSKVASLPEPNSAILVVIMSLFWLNVSRRCRDSCR